MGTTHEIQLDFNRENFRKVLNWGLDRTPYSHRAVAFWCERFWNRYCDIDAPDEIEEIMPLLAEVERDWDIFFAMNESKQIKNSEGPLFLPASFFEDWIAKLGVLERQK